MSTHRFFRNDWAARNLLDSQSSTFFSSGVCWDGNRELVGEPFLESSQAFRLQISSSRWKQGSEYRSYIDHFPRRAVPREVRTHPAGTEQPQTRCHLVDPDEAFRELPLLRGAEVHPHSALSVPLQSISPPLTCGRPLTCAHSAHAAALQVHFSDAIFIYHSAQSRRCGQCPAPTLTVSSRFLGKKLDTTRIVELSTRMTSCTCYRSIRNGWRYSTIGSPPNKVQNPSRLQRLLLSATLHIIRDDPYHP